jgi:Ser/Thr protein kinase RdoA (MazF antagonist)
MPVTPDLRGSSPALALALAPSTGSESIARFLHAVAPREVLGAVRRCLPTGGSDPVLRLVRAKLKPGRKLTAEYGVLLPPFDGVERRVAVTWTAAGASAPGPGTHAEADALRRGVLAPFHRAWIGSDDQRMSMSVSPVDDAFPQLVRLHDRGHLVELLDAAGATAGGVAAEDVTVEVIRYRPRQRHVLRVDAGPGRAAWFLKVYGDDAGRRAVDAAARAAAALAAGGNGGLSAGGGTYLAPERTALWPAVAGTPLSDVLVVSGVEAAAAVRAAGRALRLLHDAPPGDDLPIGPDAVAQAAETVRTAELLEGLLPLVAVQLRREVGRVLDVLSGLPGEPPVLAHGDFKCDNLVVDGPRLHLLDFDRCCRSDPAADIGKFLADLRWWAGAGGHAVAPLHEAFLQGYGVREPARFARSRAYDALSQLRMAARRVPVHAPDWDRRVAEAVSVAAATLAEEPTP